MVLIEARKRQIENEAIRLRKAIWRERTKALGHPPHPLEVLDAQLAASVLNFKLQYFEKLPPSISQSNFETAGFMDRDKRLIAVAECHGLEVATFTAAHELGHVVLHKKELIRHRDLPIRGLEEPIKDPIEREANYFAATFLMPTEFLSKVFRARFGAVPFVFDEAAAHFLRARDVGKLIHPYPGSRLRSTTLASTRAYGTLNFENSLAEFFRVSVATMAIQLRELELVTDYP